MSDAAPQPTPPDTPNPGAIPAHQAVLDTLITQGANLARALHDQAVLRPDTVPHRQPPAPETLIALAKAFDGTARTVRRCILLARLLAKPAPDPAAQRAAARKRILREVEDKITRAAA